MNYYAYIQSDEWKQFRKRYFKKRKRVCKFCKSAGRIHLHHITYARLGKERVSDVVPLCKECHETVHDLVKAGKANNIKHATDIVRRRRTAKPQFWKRTTRGKTRTALRESNWAFRDEMLAAFEHAIS